MSDHITIAVLALSAAGALFVFIKWLVGPKVPVEPQWDPRMHFGDDER